MGIVLLLKGHQAIPSKWVFHVKLLADEHLDKYKFRVVANGFQKTGINYMEIFSLVIKFATIRIVLIIALA